MKKIPMTLLCGYLGAGKTTLLNRVLNNTQGYRTAVIVNDIGEINVDASLISKDANITDTSSIVPLTNGCICCTLKTQMAANIEKLIKSGKYDYILIEASGVCEPLPIAQELELVKNGYLDNIVSVVDSSRMVEEFEAGNALERKDSIAEDDIESLLIQQIEFCSTLLLNKIDLISDKEKENIKKVISALHPGVNMLESVKGDVPLEKILDTHSFDFETVFSEAGWCRALDEGEVKGEEDGHEHVHKEEGSDEDEYGISTMLYTRRHPFSREKFRQSLSSFPKNIIRCKGLLWFSDESDMAYIFESSGKNLNCGLYGKWVASAPEDEMEELLRDNPEVRETWDDEVGDRIIQLCVIGKNLDKIEIENYFDSSLDME